MDSSSMISINVVPIKRSEVIPKSVSVRTANCGFSLVDSHVTYLGEVAWRGSSKVPTYCKRRGEKVAREVGNPGRNHCKNCQLSSLIGSRICKSGCIIL